MSKMSRYDRDKAEQGTRVASALSQENDFRRNFRAQTVAVRASDARWLAEQDRIYSTDYGLND